MQTRRAEFEKTTETSFGACFTLNKRCSVDWVATSQQPASSERHKVKLANLVRDFNGQPTNDRRFGPWHSSHATSILLWKLLSRNLVEEPPVETVLRLVDRIEAHGRCRNRVDPYDMHETTP